MSFFLYGSVSSEILFFSSLALSAQILFIFTYILESEC